MHIWHCGFCAGFCFKWKWVIFWFFILWIWAEPCGTHAVADTTAAITAAGAITATIQRANAGWEHSTTWGCWGCPTTLAFDGCQHAAATATATTNHIIGTVSTHAQPAAAGCSTCTSNELCCAGWSEQCNSHLRNTAGKSGARVIFATTSCILKFTPYKSLFHYNFKRGMAHELPIQLLIWK